MADILKDNLNTPELQNLQENIYKKIHELELKLNDKTKEIMTLTEKKFQNIDNTFDSHNARLSDLSITVNTNKHILEKVPDISNKYTLVSEDIYQHNVKLIQIQKDLTSATNKFDKIFVDNLNLPGVIGSGNCKYKNIKEYIDVQYHLNNLLTI